MFCQLSLSQLFLALSICTCYVSASYPFLIYSHKLVPKVQTYVNNFNKFILPLERVTEVTRKTIDPCSSYSYIFIDQPGLTLDDLQDWESFTYLRTFALISSTIGSVPRVEKPVSFDKLTNYTMRKCKASYIEVNGHEEAETYIDNKVRVIRINLPQLPDEPKARKKALMKADHTIKINLRKLPSPDHTIIYSNTQERILNKQHERRWEKLDIFPDITKHFSRNQEFERNENVVEVERPFPQKRLNIIDKTQWKVPEFLDAEVIYENELLVIGILAITAVLILIQILIFFAFIFRKLVQRFGSSTAKGDKTKKE